MGVENTEAKPENDVEGQFLKGMASCAGSRDGQSLSGVGRAHI